MPYEALIFKDLAALLRGADKTAYAMAAAGESPAFNIGRHWHLERIEIEQWVDAQPRGNRSGKGNDDGR